MTRDINRSPFDVAQPGQTEDWLEDLETNVALVDDGETARELSDLRKSLELRLASLTIPQLESRLKGIESKLEPLVQERDFRTKATRGEDKAGITALNQRIIPMGIEDGVIRRLIADKKTRQAEIDLVASIEDDVVPHIEGAPSEEETARIDRAKRQGHRVTAETLQTIREDLMDEYVRLDVEQEALINKKDEASLDHYAKLLKRMNEIRGRLNMTGKEMQKLVRDREASKKQPDRIKQVRTRAEEQTEYSQQAAELKKALYEGKPVNARVKPESGWSRFKRGFSNLFGQSSPKIKPEAPVAKPPQKEPVRFERDILSKGIISARTEPPKEQPGFFARLFKRMEKPAGSEFAKAQKIAGGSKYMRDGVALPPPDAVRLKLEARETEDRARIAAGKEKIARYGTEPEIETPPDSAEKDVA